MQRRWIPHREGRGLDARFPSRKRRGRGKGSTPVLDLSTGGDPSGVVVLAILGILAVIMIVAAPGILLVGIDLVWFALAFLGTAFAHFVLRRPWRIEAVADDGTRHVEYVRGYRSAGLRCQQWAAEIQQGFGPRPEPRRPEWHQPERDRRDTGPHD